MLPKVHSPEVFAEVIARVAKGETIAAAAKRIGVDRAAVTNWARRFPEFGRDLAKAMEDGADALADETLRIVDGDDLEDEVEMLDLTTKQLALVPRKVKLAAAGGDPVARARLRSEMRLKLLAARSPEKYGNKVLHAGHDGGAIKTSHAIDIKSIAAQLRAAAAGRTIEGSATVSRDTSAPRFEADGKMRRRLTQSSDSFNGGPISNEGDSQCPPHSTQSETRNASRVATRGEAQGSEGAAVAIDTSAPRFEADGQVGDRGGPATPRGAESAPARKRGPIVAKHTSTQNSNNSSTCFPGPAEWSPEDYV